MIDLNLEYHIHSTNMYCVPGYSVPGTVTGFWDIEGNKIDKILCSCGGYTLVGGDNNLSKDYLR